MLHSVLPKYNCMDISTPPINTHIHTYAYTNAYTYTYTFRSIYIYIYIYIKVDSYIYIYIYINIDIYTYIYRDINIYLYIYINIDIYIYMHIYKHAYTYTHNFTYTNTHPHPFTTPIERHTQNTHLTHQKKNRPHFLATQLAKQTRVGRGKKRWASSGYYKACGKIHTEAITNNHQRATLSRVWSVSIRLDLT